MHRWWWRCLVICEWAPRRGSVVPGSGPSPGGWRMGARTCPAYLTTGQPSFIHALRRVAHVNKSFLLECLPLRVSQSSYQHTTLKNTVEKLPLCANMPWQREHERSSLITHFSSKQLDPWFLSQISLGNCNLCPLLWSIPVHMT